MSKKNEDSLERFFRKAVSQHDTTFRESDWLKMEKMLEEKAAERAALRLANLKRVGYSLAGLAIILTGIYFLTLDGNSSMSTEEVLPGQVQVAAGEEAPVTDHEKEKPAASLHSSVQPHNNNNKEEKSASAEAVVTEDPAGSQRPDSEEEIALQENNAAPLAQLPHANGTNVNKGSPVNKGQAEKRTAQADIRELQPLRSQNRGDQNHKAETGQRTEKTGEQQNTMLSVVPADKTLGTGPSRHQPAGSPDNQERTGVVARSEKEAEDSHQVTDDPKKTELPVAGDPSRIAVENHKRPLGENDETRQQVDPAIQSRTARTDHADNGIAADPEKTEREQADRDTVATEETVEAATLPDEKFKPVPTRWNVALVLAPDFSSTALERYTAPGEAYGFAVGYRFFGRFTAATGLVRSTKKYVGYGSDYQPPEGYWRNRTNGIVPDDITGKCAILEIPLMVQYAFGQKEKSRMYVAAGVSSYIMLSESYLYSFDAPNPGAARGWSTTESSRYPFAIGHLSAAYERNLSQRWAIGLEPFLKIPFAGVGWTNVDLYSTGVFFNLRYRFFRKQQFTVPEERKTTH